MSTDRQFVVLQFGDLANHVATGFWNSQAHLYEKSYDKAELNPSAWFRDSDTVHPSPRALLYQVKPGAGQIISEDSVDAVSPVGEANVGEGFQYYWQHEALLRFHQSSLKELPNTASLLSTFADGDSYADQCGMLDSFEDDVRHMVEECDIFSGFVTITSSNAYAGLFHRASSLLLGEYDKATRMTFGLEKRLMGDKISEDAFDFLSAAQTFSALYSASDAYYPMLMGNLSAIQDTKFHDVSDSNMNQCDGLAAILGAAIDTKLFPFQCRESAQTSYLDSLYASKFVGSLSFAISKSGGRLGGASLQNLTTFGHPVWLKPTRQPRVSFTRPTVIARVPSGAIAASDDPHGMGYPYQCYTRLGCVSTMLSIERATFVSEYAKWLLPRIPRYSTHPAQRADFSERREELIESLHGIIEEETSDLD